MSIQNKNRVLIVVVLVLAAFVMFMSTKRAGPQTASKSQSEAEPDPFYLTYNQPPIPGVNVGGSTVYGGNTSIGGVNMEGSVYNYYQMPSGIQPPPPQSNKCNKNKNGLVSAFSSPSAMVFNTARAMPSLPEYVSTYVSQELKSLDKPIVETPPFTLNCDRPVTFYNFGTHDRQENFCRKHYS